MDLGVGDTGCWKPHVVRYRKLKCTTSLKTKTKLKIIEIAYFCAVCLYLYLNICMLPGSVVIKTTIYI